MLRLTARANFMRSLVPSLAAGRFGITTAIVDTGAFYSLIAERLWRHFLPGLVAPLPFDTRTPQHLRATTIADGTFPYTLGELTLNLQNSDLSLYPVTVIAKLLHDGGRLAVPLTLGLRGGFLDGRKVRAEPDPVAAFGQEWTVSDA
jgi:hypothetical protein